MKEMNVWVGYSPIDQGKLTIILGPFTLALTVSRDLISTSWR